MFIAMLQEYRANKDKYKVDKLRGGFISGSGVPEELVK
jgi:hypothetical protein